VSTRDAKHVPGRKTDVSDAQWLQRLHLYGLLRASFRPKGQIAELRAYVRQREPSRFQTLWPNYLNHAKSFVLLVLGAALPAEFLITGAKRVLQPESDAACASQHA
jgi:hypothetical protein